MRNKVTTTVSANFYSIFCNEVKIATFFVLFPTSQFETIKKSKEAVERLKWGVHNNLQVQKKFDAVLN